MSDLVGNHIVGFPTRWPSVIGSLCSHVVWNLYLQQTRELVGVVVLQ